MFTTRATPGCSGEGGLLSLPSASAKPPALDDLEARLGYRFEQRELLERALTHSSRAHEAGDPGRDNERLEFLGDAVLGLVVAELLMERHPDVPEGNLSRARARLVNTRSLDAHARALELDLHLRLGRGELRSGGRDKPSILANVFEAVLGALYLDGGLGAVRTLVEREFAGAIANADQPLPDPKTHLQEQLQAKGEEVPGYTTTATHGPDHARVFEVEVQVGERVLGTGKGSSKREAEQEAARHALAALGE